MIIKPTVAISDNGFLFDPNSGESYTTNAVGREIIFMMKQKVPHNEIMATIAGRYDVDELTLEKNMIDFLAMLRHYNLCDDSGQ
jgi:hypothetical protein